MQLQAYAMHTENGCDCMSVCVYSLLYMLLEYYCPKSGLTTLMTAVVKGHLQSHAR